MSDDARAQLEQMRTYHQDQLTRINDALALLRDAGKLAGKASRLTDKARERATGVVKPVGPTAISWVRDNADFDTPAPMAEIKRLVKAAYAQGHRHIKLPGTQAAFYAARTALRSATTVRSRKPLQRPVVKRKAHRGVNGHQKYLQRKTGDTPIGRIRAFFLANPDAPLTNEALIASARLDGTMTKAAMPGAVGRIMVLMQQNREVKRTPDGWVALNVKVPRATANNNSNGQQAAASA